MSKIFLSTIFLFWSLTLRTVNCQNESCIDFSYLSNIDTDRYQGHWNMYALADSAAVKDCAYYYITKREDGLFDIDNIYYTPSKERVTEYMLVRVINSDAPEEPSSANIYNYVLSTDYENYSTVYHCEDNPDGIYVNLGLLTRKRIPDEDTVNKAKAVFKENGLGSYPLYNVNQTDCPEN